MNWSDPLGIQFLSDELVWSSEDTLSIWWTGLILLWDNHYLTNWSDPLMMQSLSDGLVWACETFISNKLVWSSGDAICIWDNYYLINLLDPLWRQTFSDKLVWSSGWGYSLSDGLVDPLLMQSLSAEHAGSSCETIIIWWTGLIILWDNYYLINWSDSVGYSLYLMNWPNPLLRQSVSTISIWWTGLIFLWDNHYLTNCSDRLWCTHYLMDWSDPLLTYLLSNKLDWTSGGAVPIR